MGKTRVLVIEDDPAIRRGIVDALGFDGYAVIESGDGVAGGELAVQGDYDLLLLDLVLPGRDGFEILAEVRRSRPTLPVIILTARGREDDRVRGLRGGADDYVVKPFSVRELLARIKAVLRRSPERPGDLEAVAFAHGIADLARREIVYSAGDRCSLSEREAELLRYLAINAGRAVSRDEIIARVWRLNPRAIVATRTIDMHVARLREKLRDQAADPQIIRTVRGVGYAFEPGPAPPCKP
jgi:DNA-binding response OmpR family regulator